MRYVMLLLLCRLKREIIWELLVSVEVPFLSSLLCKSTEQGWRTPREAPNESNEAQPNYRRQGLSRYLLQIGCPPPPPPRRPRSAFHVEERAPLSRESLFIGNRSYSNPSRFLPRTRTDANFFFQSIENRGPEKGFIWFDAIARDIVVPRQTEEVFLIGKQNACDGVVKMLSLIINNSFVLFPDSAITF